MAYGLDIHPADTLYWVTDMGWMMGPWLVFGTLLLGATMMLYDGGADYPTPDRQWAIVEQHGVTGLGISPTLIRALMRYGDDPVRKHDLSTLRVHGSTGEPWNPDHGCGSLIHRQRAGCHHQLLGGTRVQAVLNEQRAAAARMRVCGRCGRGCRGGRVRPFGAIKWVNSSSISLVE
jgi:hypothetical protein